jgi:hypothetical protein
MTKLKLGPLADDKPVKIGMNYPPGCIAIWSLMRRPSAATADKRRPIRRN